MNSILFNLKRHLLLSSITRWSQSHSGTSATKICLPDDHHKILTLSVFKVLGKAKKICSEASEPRPPSTQWHASNGTNAIYNQSRSPKPLPSTKRCSKKAPTKKAQPRNLCGNQPTLSSSSWFPQSLKKRQVLSCWKNCSGLANSDAKIWSL